MDDKKPVETIDAPIHTGKGRPVRAIKAKQDLNKQQVDAVSKEMKLDLFLQEFLKNGGNATRAAMSVYPNQSYASAAVTGSRLFKEVQVLARIYLEEKGHSYGKLIDVALEKMQSADAKDFVPLWDRIMKIAGYEDFLNLKQVNSSPQIVNIVAAQKELMKSYVDGEVVDETDS